MPQVFGSDELTIIAESSLWVESATEGDIERATHPAVAAEARSRGLAPLRMGKGPIWHHPESGQIATLTPAHTGDSPGYNRAVKNVITNLRRKFPTEEELARASRTPEETEAERDAAAKATRTKKQERAEAARRKKQQEEAALYRKQYHPFKSREEVQRAFDRRSPDARMVRPRETVDDFAERLRDMTPADRQRIHKALFPDRYQR